MKATKLECRYQRLLHLGIVGLAFCTYLVDREDVVWRFVKDTAAPHQWERFCFLMAAALIALGALACTWARAKSGDVSPVGSDGQRHATARYCGEFCYALGLGALFPLTGFAILVGGEAFRIFRLLERAATEMHEEFSEEKSVEAKRLPKRLRKGSAAWMEAMRVEAVKWGLVATMLVFVVTLRDRDADVLVAASLVIGVALNAPQWCRAETMNARAES